MCEISKKSREPDCSPGCLLLSYVNTLSLMAIFSFAKCITVKVLIATESQRKRKVARTLEGCEWRKCDISVKESFFCILNASSNVDASF